MKILKRTHVLLLACVLIVGLGNEHLYSQGDSANLWQDAIKLYEASRDDDAYSSALKKHEEIREIISTITHDHPTSIVAKTIRDGAARIGPYSVDEFENILIPKTTALALAESDMLECAYYLTKLIPDEYGWNPEKKAGSLLGVACAYGEVGNIEKHSKVLSESVNFINSIHPDLKDWALCGVRTNFTYRDKKYDDIFDLFRLSGQDMIRYMGEIHLIDWFFEIGQRDSARVAADRALQNEKYKSRYLEIVDILVKNGEYQKASEICNKTNVLDAAIQNCTQRKYPNKLLTVSSLYAKLGDFEKAIEISNRLKTKHWLGLKKPPRYEIKNKAQALKTIAVEYAKDGRFEDAIKLAKSICNRRWFGLAKADRVEKSQKSYALREIALLYAEGGSFEDALKTARSIGYVDTRTKTLGKIAVLCFEENPDMSREILSQAVDVIQDLDDKYRVAIIKTYAEIALAYIKISEIEKSKEIIKTIEKTFLPDADKKIMQGLFHDVAVEYAKLGDCQMVEKVLQHTHDPVTIREVALGYAENGRWIETLEIIVKNGDYAYKADLLADIGVKFHKTSAAPSDELQQLLHDVICQTE